MLFMLAYQGTPRFCQACCWCSPDMRIEFCVALCAGQMRSQAEEETRLHADATCSAALPCTPLSCKGVCLC